jgi:outer membrane protein assembly factor BamE (lipoprotein component of BamABCDE complex)
MHRSAAAASFAFLTVRVSLYNACVQRALLFGVLLLIGSCGGDDAQGSCLTNAQICQFKKGTSTKAEVMSKLGNAQQYLGTDVMIYVCQQVSGSSVVHNDIVSFSFDDKGVLEDVTVLRQGSGATPPPDCIR